MKKSKRRKRDSTLQIDSTRSAETRYQFGNRHAVLILTLTVIAFYWPAMTSSKTSIQWDAVDVHYSAQKYFAERLWAGELPHWTPYIFSGYPFLADPQVGAWYPLNWPFFLAGVTPKAIQFELALHALIAVLGAFLIFRQLLGHLPAAMAGALAYGLSGFFAGHSSHVGMFSAAALLPWLLLCFRLAMDRSFWPYTAMGGVTGGCTILVGHFQTALYGFTALALFTIGEQHRKRAPWLRVGAFLVVVCVLSLLISGVMVLPGVELTAHSIRSGADFSTIREGSLTVGALATLVYANFYGLFSDEYQGPQDITQYYFYAGILLVPLVALGLRNRNLRLAALLLVLVPVWYMAGPEWGLYRLVGMLPGYGHVRAPVNGWFVAMLGLSLLASAGMVELSSRWKWRFPSAIAVAVLALDLCWFNSWTNPLAYARVSFEELYGYAERRTARVAESQPPLTRFHAEDKLGALGPMNHPLDLRLEATYGYNPLQLSAYADYRAALERNPRLLAGLNVTRRLDTQSGRVVSVSPTLPRAYFAPAVAQVASPNESKRLLLELDPQRLSLVERPHPLIDQDAGARAEVESAGEQNYRVRYRASSPSLLRMSVPYYPGWMATFGDKRLDVLRVDHAFLGVVVPPGEGVVEFRFQSRQFTKGAWLSGLGLLLTTIMFGIRPSPFKSTGSPALSSESK